jgi:hypothetical protein
MKTDTNIIEVDIKKLGESTVAVLCLAMPEALRCKGVVRQVDNYQLRSDATFYMDEDTLWLPGFNRGRDDDVISCTFPTAAKADAWITAISGLIDAVNEELAAKAEPPEPATIEKVVRGELISAASGYLIIQVDPGRYNGLCRYTPADVEVRLIEKEEFYAE